MPGIAWKRSNWIEWAAVPLVCAAMLASWVAPLLHFILGLSIVQPRGLVYPAWLVVALLLCASAAKSLLPNSVSGRVRGAILGLIAIFVVLVGFSPYNDASSTPSPASVGQTIRSLAEWQEGIPATFLFVVMSAALWARGLAADWINHGELWRAFALGVLVLGFLVLLSGRGGAAQSIALGRAIMAFLLTGLLALALLAALDVLSIQRPFSKRAAGLNRYWLSAVVLALLAIMFFGWLLGQLLAPEAVAQFVRWLDPLRRFVGQILSLLFTAFVYVFFILVMAIWRLVSRWIGQPDPDTSEAMETAKEIWQETEEATRSLHISPELRLILVLLFLILGSLFLFFVVWRFRRRRTSRDQVLEERQSIGSKELLLDQLARLFRRSPHVDPFLDLSSASGPRRTIRLLYQRILAAAKSVDHPRAPGQTPSAYERALGRVVPAHQSDLHTLTEAYLDARYGGQDPSADTVGSAADAAAAVEQALRRRHAP